MSYILPGHVSQLGMGGQLCKIDLPVHMRQEGSSISSVSNKYGLFAPVSRLGSACGLGQCWLGFGTSSVLGKKWGAPAAPGLASYLQCV